MMQARLLREEDSDEVKKVLKWPSREAERPKQSVEGVEQGVATCDARAYGTGYATFTSSPIVVALRNCTSTMKFSVSRDFT
jgi:hypothetical protein